MFCRSRELNWFKGGHVDKLQSLDKEGDRQKQQPHQEKVASCWVKLHTQGNLKLQGVFGDRPCGFITQGKNTVSQCLETRGSRASQGW